MKKRILIIDDDAILAEQMGEALENGGYDVEHVSEGEAGYSRAEECAFDLCLIDYKLEHVTGADILKKIKKQSPHCRAIILTGKPNVKQALEKEGAGDLADAIIQKPFKVPELLQKIEEMCGEVTSH